MDPSTPGSIIAKAKRGEKIQLTDRDTKVEVQCEIKNFRFSAHSKREELISIVKHLHPDEIVLIHGVIEAIDWIGSTILKLFPTKKVFAPHNYKQILFD
jgi:predicted metal-dependent RNase